MTKTMLITGTSTGIGKATARYFHQKGWNVAATMRNMDKAQDLTTYPNLLCLPLDVTQTDTIKRAIAQTIDHFGKIDIVVNNAGCNLTGPFEGAQPEQIRAMFDVNVFGVMNVVREILPHFRERMNGTIINISSLAGRIGIPVSSFYSSSKWALEGFTESLMYELQPFNIHVKLIEPGAYRTSFADNTVIVRKPEVPVYEAMINKRLDKYEQRRATLQDPVEIVRIIEHCITKPGNGLRHIAGNDAKLVWKLRKVLPFFVFRRLLKRAMGI